MCVRESERVRQREGVCGKETETPSALPMFSFRNGDLRGFRGIR